MARNWSYYSNVPEPWYMRIQTNMVKIAFLALMVAAGYVAISVIAPSQCKAYAALNNTEYEYSIISGCMVKQPNGRWIFLDQIRNIEP